MRETLHRVRRVVRWMRHQCDKRPFPWWSRWIARDGFNVTHETDTAGLQKARNDRGVLVCRELTAHTETSERALDSRRLDCRGLAFIDLGCGQEQPLLLAPRRPCDRLIGRDVDPRRIAVAQRNCDRLGREQRVALELADAAEFVFPLQPPVLYVFKPFPECAMRRVVQQRAARLRAHPGAAAVISMNPANPQAQKLSWAHAVEGPSFQPPWQLICTK